jgi:predicted PurR-regulated permease PerM
MTQETSQQKIWGWAIILALVGGFLFVRPFLSTILLGILFAFLAFPIHKRFLKKWPKRQNIAVALTTIFTFVVVLIPLAFVLIVAVVQGTQLVNSIDVDTLTDPNSSLQQTITSSVNEANTLLSGLTGDGQTLSVQKVQDFVRNIIPDVISIFVNGIIGIISGIPTFFVHLIMFIFVFVGILYNQKSLLETIRYLSPFGKTYTESYLKKMGAMATAMTRGQLIIATLQGITSALGLLVLGLGDYFFILALIFTFLSFIPLGAGIVTIPIGIIAILFGQVWQGVVILLNHFLVVSSIDNFRPALVPKDARLPAALTLIAAFSGVAIFGFLGVIYGPVIMIVITTTIQAYVEMRKRQTS